MKSIDISHHADFRPHPVQIRVGSEDIEVRSLNCAIDLIRSLRHDRLGNYAEMLLVQLEAAREPEQQAKAWTAFRTWSTACGLDAEIARAA
jgi:hypothetical protein